MNIAPAQNARPPAAMPGHQAAANSPPSLASSQPELANPPLPGAENEMAVVAVLGYN